MRIYYELEPGFLDATGALLPGASEFQKRYEHFRLVPGNFVFTDKGIAKSAMTALNQFGLKGTSFYRIELDESEIASHPAFYLGVNFVFDLLSENGLDLERLEWADIAADYASEKIVVSTRMRQLLTTLAANLRFEPIANTSRGEWCLLSVFTRLPDPVDIPVPVEIAAYESDPDLWSVRSDGRYVIGPSNVAIVRGAGIAISDVLRTGDGRELHCREKFIISGSVLSAFRAASMSGLLKSVVPLITEEQSRGIDDIEP